MRLVPLRYPLRSIGVRWTSTLFSALGIGLSFAAETAFRGAFGILIPNYFVEPRTALIGMGIALGVALSFVAEKSFRAMFGILIPNYFVEPSTAGVGLAIALGVGFFAGLLPSIRLTRLRTVDVLREGA